MQRGDRVQRQQESFMDNMVRTVIWLNSIFAALILAIFFIKGQEPTTLVQCWFVSFTAELLAMAAIQIKKNKMGGGDNEQPPI